MEIYVIYIIYTCNFVLLILYIINNLMYKEI